MMDFPSANLTPGTIVTFANGQSYRWNGGQWDLLIAGVLTEIPKVTGFGVNGTWTPDAKMVHGWMWGKGGGGGGGNCAVSPGSVYGTCGGGEGNTVMLYFKKTDITLSSYVVTVGAGGAPSGAGGDSAVGGILLAKGGGAGAQFGAGQPNTVGNIGHSVIYGATGGMGMQGTNAGGAVGFGGSGGGPGAAGATAGGTTAANGFNAGVNTGGGGGGAASSNAGPGNIIGGGGGSGVVYIIEYCTT